jgi:phosphoglycolate phosphatase
MQITHVVWDWNGTLLDDLDLSIETINSILEENKLKKINKEEYRKKFCFPIITYYDNVGLDISGNNFNELSKKYIERYQPKSRNLTTAST